MLLALAPIHARLAVVSLDSGERVQGEILKKSNASTLYLQSDLLGQITVPRTRVVKIEDTAPSPPAAKPAAKATPPKPAPKKAAPKPIAKKAAPKPAPTKAPKPAATAKPEAKAADDRWFTFPEMPELPEFPENWKGNLRFGMNISSGDQEWTETNIRGRLDITEGPRYYRLTGSYVYRENERANGRSFKSIDRYDANAIFRYSVNDQFFVQNSIAGRSDQRKQIDLEAQETVGLGYSYKPSKELEFIVGGGGGVEYYEVPALERDGDFLPVLNVFQELTWRPWKRASLVQSFNYFWNPKDTNDYSFVWSSAIRFRLNHTLGFELAFDRNFDNEVLPSQVQDDSRWRNAIIVYF